MKRSQAIITREEKLRVASLLGELEDQDDGDEGADAGDGAQALDARVVAPGVDELLIERLDLAFAFAAMAKERVGALLVVADAIFNLHRTRLADLAAKSHLPAAYGVREYVEAGGLMSYGPSFPDLYRRAATYVDKILKGVKPADLPVEQPTKFELVINRASRES